MVISIILQNWSGSSFVRPQSYRVIDIINLVAITLYFGIKYYAAGNRRSFCVHWLSLVDICCWIALLCEIVVPTDDVRQSKYEYRFFLMIRTIRLVQVFRLRRLAKTAKARQSLLIALTGMCILICAAATFQTIEYCDSSEPKYVDGQNCQDLSFFDAVYFVCITIGTVGYGEYAPKTKMGKVADIFLIIFTGVLIPTQISGLTDILNRETAFDKKYIPDKRIQHVLLCGDIDNSSLNFFLHSWLRGEGERGNRRKVIILSPTLPSSSLRRVLIHREYEQRVLYLQGSAMDANDLTRAGAQSAAYCFVMVKKHSALQDQDDTATNLITCSIRKNNRHAPLYVQVSRSDNIRHINISGASAVVCLEQLKLSLFAKSLWIRGLNSFLGNMVQRFDITEEKGGFWLNDYIGGCGHRIYEASIPSFLLAMATFRSLAILIYREFNVPLIGIRTLQDSVLVYPVDKDLNDIGFHSVFFLSKTRETISKIEKLTNSVFARHLDISPSIEMGSAKSSKTITGVLQSAISATNPFQRLSMVILTDRHGDSLAHASSRIHDKITPLDQDDDAGESESFQDQTNPRLNRVNRNELPRPRQIRHPSSIRDDDDMSNMKRSQSDSDSGEAQYVPPVVPVVALTPAQLLAKASAPVSPRESLGRPIVSPRTPRPVSPRRSEEQHELKPSSGRPVSSTTIAVSGPAANNVPKADQTESEESATTRSIRHSSAIDEGPQVSTIYAAYPSKPPESPPEDEIDQSEALNKFDDHETVGTTGSFKRKSVDNIPVRRRTSTQREQNRFSRSSKYRSFRRRAPPASLTGHYVVCGIPSSYTSLMASLHDVGEEPVPVVFVTPADLSEKDFGAYVEFKNVFFVRGSPVSMETFDEARMLHAKSILITSYCGQTGGNGAIPFDENMADVDAITTHRFISEACQNRSQRTATVQPPIIKVPQRSSWQPVSLLPFIVVEMMRPSNVKFLVDRSGKLYDEHAVVNQVRTKDILRDTHALDDAFFSPLYAGGNIFFSNFMDALLGSSSQNSFLIDMVTQLVISGNSSLHQLDRDARSPYRLSQIPVPNRYHNRPFALLVEGLLVNENTVALGLYRAAQGFVAPAYVVTNPAPNELVHAHDLVFVIK